MQRYSIINGSSVCKPLSSPIDNKGIIGTLFFAFIYLNFYPCDCTGMTHT